MEEAQYCWTLESLPFGNLHHPPPPDDLPILHHLHQKTQSIINHAAQHNDSSLVLNILSDDATIHGAEDKYLPALDYYSPVLRRQYYCIVAVVGADYFRGYKIRMTL